MSGGERLELGADCRYTVTGSYASSGEWRADPSDVPGRSAFAMQCEKCDEPFELQAIADGVSMALMDRCGSATVEAGSKWLSPTRFSRDEGSGSSQSWTSWSEVIIGSATEAHVAVHSIVQPAGYDLGWKETGSWAATPAGFTFEHKSGTRKFALLAGCVAEDRERYQRVD